MTIVTTTYRYKPPPKRKGRKLAEITGPAVVVGKGGRHRVANEAAAEVGGLIPPVPAEGGRCAVKHESAGPRERWLQLRR